MGTKEAINAAAAAKQGATKPVSLKEVGDFSDHCVYIRSVYRFAMRIWRDSTNDQRKLMEGIAPLFFEDMAQVLTEYVVIAACRITDGTGDRAGNENFTVETFVNSFASDPVTQRTLYDLHERMKKLRRKILPARHKLVAHADREAIRSGKPLGFATHEEWADFWSALRDFVRIVNEKKLGRPFDIDAAGVQGDSEALLKSFRQSHGFETLLNSGDPVVTEACVKLALPN